MNATLQDVHLYLEDLTPGQQYSSPAMKVDAAQIKAFARQFDPQPFHVDEEVAGNSFFKGLAASGWHTAALTMRLLVESDLSIAGGIIGAGCEEIRWPQPVRPDDELHVRSEIIEVRRSKSRPHQGIVKVRTTTFNQHDEPVQMFTGNLIVPRRP